MAANIGWYNTDDVTPLSAIDMGTVPPGSDYFTRTGAYKEARVKNDGDQNFVSVTAEVQQRHTYPAYTYLQLATGATPGAFGSSVALGAMAPAAVAQVWVDAIVPSGETPQAGQAANLVLFATL